MDLAMFTFNCNPNIRAYLKEKYPDLEDELHKAALRLFLLPCTPRETLLDNDTEHEAAGNEVGGNK